MAPQTKTWRRVIYDVWGNSNEGYEVNGAFYNGTIDIKGKTPTLGEIRKAFGVGRIHLEIEDKETAVYVYRKRDRYPIGELRRPLEDAVNFSA